MSDRSPSNRSACAVAVLALALAGSSIAYAGGDGNRDDPLLRYRTTARDHGLYDIQLEAAKFLRSQPQKKSGPWIAAGPDIRMQVPRCTGPLRTRWARASDATEDLPGVVVNCVKTVDRKQPSWSIILPAYVEAERKLEVQRRFPGFKDERAGESK